MNETPVVGQAVVSHFVQLVQIASQIDIAATCRKGLCHNILKRRPEEQQNCVYLIKKVEIRCTTFP